MLKAVVSWAKTVVTAALVAGIIDMLLPSGSSRNYVRLVTGTVVLLAIASPLFALHELSPDDLFSRELEKLTADYDRTRMKIAADQLAARVELVLKQSPYVHEVTVTSVAGNDLLGQSVERLIVEVTADRSDLDTEQQLHDALVEAVMLASGLDRSRIVVRIVAYR